MARGSREKSNSGIYHILIRGINRQNIFENNEDRIQFIDLLYKNRKTTGYQLYAYCLINNHIHLLIKEGDINISNLMKRILTSYVYWYNWQHNRRGHLFQDRFKSETVEDNDYLLKVLRFIHQNPLHAGLVFNMEDYQWSSYNEYIRGTGSVDRDYILDIFARESTDAIKEYVKFNHDKTNDKCLDISINKPITKSDQDVKKAILLKYRFDLTRLKNQTNEIQSDVLKYMKKIEGVSLRQIVRLTGFPLHKVYKA